MEPKKIVYNRAVSGGLHLSEKAMAWLRERGVKLEVESSPRFGPYVKNLPRHDKLLVECIETLGEEANGPENGWTCQADLQVAEIAGNHYYINDHDGAGEEVIDFSKMIDASDEQPRYKVVYNDAIGGGIVLSGKATEWLREHGFPWDLEPDVRYDTCCMEATSLFPRHHPLLVQCVESLGEEANGTPEYGSRAQLRVAEITAQYYHIDVGDAGGRETIVDISLMADASESYHH